MKEPKRITVLVPVFNEEACLPTFVSTVQAALADTADYTFNFLFIDDGSRDASWSMIRDICAKNPAFQGIRLSRNFGSHIALCAGFDLADADAVCTLACDLQDPPQTILQFLARWEKGAKIVWGRRSTRKDQRWRILCSNLFFTLVRRYAMPRHSKFTTGSFLLADRAVVDCVRKLREHNRITFALVAWTGFDQDVVDYDRAERLAGKSGWNFSRMVKTMYDTVIGFSVAPIKLITMLGLGVSVGSLCFLLYLLLSWLLGNPQPGWTSVMAAITGFFGLLFLTLGVIGEYLQRIYFEVLGRPLYVISEEARRKE